MKTQKHKLPKKGLGTELHVTLKVTAYARATGERSDSISGHHLKALL